ncbi:MAG: GAF domain-containing protein [Burkholderiales bacterium]
MSALSYRLPFTGLRRASKVESAGSAPPPRFLGVRVDALLEIAAFLALALAIDAFWGAGDRFSGVVPHPFWIVVLVTSSYYGISEGLAAAALATVALLLGQLPEPGIGEDTYSWLLRSTLLPLGWCIGALVLGQIQSAFRRRLASLEEELEKSREHLRIVTEASERLHQQRDHLEARVASQLLTVSAIYNAWLSIEKHTVGDVLLGVGELVRTVMNPQKFSLYLLSGSQLEAAMHEGWTDDDHFDARIDASAPLFHAIVTDRRFLSIADTADEPLLRDSGVMAGPIVNADSGEFVGMLKIEAIGFLDLHPTSIRNFRTLCAWIGAALANAEKVESLQKQASDSPQGNLLPPALFERQRESLHQLSQCIGFDASVMYLSVDDEGGGDPRGEILVKQAVAVVARQVLDSTQPCFNYRTDDSGFAVLLPGAGRAAGEAVMKVFVRRLAQELSEAGHKGSISHVVVPL